MFSGLIVLRLEEVVMRGLVSLPACRLLALADSITQRAAASSLLCLQTPSAKVSIVHEMGEEGSAPRVRTIVPCQMIDSQRLVLSRHPWIERLWMEGWFGFVIFATCTEGRPIMACCFKNIWESPTFLRAGRMVETSPSSNQHATAEAKCGFSCLAWR